MNNQHAYIVKNLSGTFCKTIKAKNSAEACIAAFKQYGAHHKCKMIATMIEGK